MRSKRKFIILFVLIPVLSLSCIILGTPTPPPTDTPEPLTDTPEIPTDTITPETPTDTPTPAPPCPPATLPIPGWTVYCNDTYEFYAPYPPDAIMGDTDFNFARIDLSIEPDTNLSEKYLEIIVRETSDACSSAMAEGYPSERVERKNLVINGISWDALTKGGPMRLRQVVAKVLISTFVLHHHLVPTLTAIHNAM